MVAGNIHALLQIKAMGGEALNTRIQVDLLAVMVLGELF
jgi:hypothetical protein